MSLTKTGISDTMGYMEKQASRNNLKIDPELHRRLKVLAAFTGRTMQQVIQEHVDAELDRLGIEKKQQEKNR